MRKEPSQDMIEALNAVAEHLGAEYFTISTPIICDHCQNDTEEAFPYCVKDRDGKEWEHLCNGCFDELGCKYDEWDEE